MFHSVAVAMPDLFPGVTDRQAPSQVIETLLGMWGCIYCPVLSPSNLWGTGLENVKL